MSKNNKTKWSARQGDLYIQHIDDIPAGATKTKPVNGEIVLAHGEASTHHHSIAADTADWWKEEEEGDQYVSVTKPTAMQVIGTGTEVHERHTPIPLKKRKYMVRRQVEYTPEAIRPVGD